MRASKAIPIQTGLPLSPELRRLLDEARVPTEKELHEQRISFAYGNAMNLNGITKESVRRAAQHIRLVTVEEK